MVIRNRVVATLLELNLKRLICYNIGVDTRLRNLERRWKNSNSDDDFLAYYRAYLRSGEKPGLFHWGAWIGAAHRMGMEISLPRQYFRTLEHEILVLLSESRFRKEKVGYWETRRTNIIISRTSEPVQKLEMPLVIYGYVPANERQTAIQQAAGVEMPDIGTGYIRFFSDGTYDFRSGGIENDFGPREPNEFRCGMGVLNFITDTAEDSLPD